MDLSGFDIICAVLCCCLTERWRQSVTQTCRTCLTWLPVSLSRPHRGLGWGGKKRRPVKEMFLQLKLQTDTFAIFISHHSFFHYLAEKQQKLTDSVKMNFFTKCYCSTDTIFLRVFKLHDITHQIMMLLFPLVEKVNFVGLFEVIIILFYFFCIMHIYIK